MTALSGQTPIAVVALEAVAAGQAAPRLEEGVGPRRGRRRPRRRWSVRRAASSTGRTVPGRVGVVPGVEAVERCESPARAGATLGLSAQPGVDGRAARLAVADGDRSACGSAGTMSPPANTPGAARHHLVRRPRRPRRLDRDPGIPLEQRQVRLLPERQDHACPPRAPRTRRWAGGSRRVELHPFDREGSAPAPIDGRQPLESHALVDGVLTSSTLRRHALPGAPVDDERRPRRRAVGPCGRRPCAVLPPP